MTALYFDALRPEDRVAVKPHASPIFHAIQYLLGMQTREKLENFRGYGGAQSYPSRTKDIDDVDFSTGSVGLGVAQTLFASLVQDYIKGPWLGEGTPRRPHGRAGRRCRDGRGQHLRGAAGRLEARRLRNTWWVVDYNRQCLDAVIREGLWERFEAMFRDLRLGRGDPEIRRAAARPRFTGAGRRDAARLDRPLPQPALFGADLSRAAPPGASGWSKTSAIRAR